MVKKLIIKQRFLGRLSLCDGLEFILDYADPGQSWQIKDKLVDMAMNCRVNNAFLKQLHLDKVKVDKSLAEAPQKQDEPASELSK